MRVSDNGQGIPSGEQESIFARFHQIRPAKGADTKGTGLGLPICKGLVEAHGGRLTVESEQGRGSTFTFDLEGVVRSKEESVGSSQAGAERSGTSVS